MVSLRPPFCVFFLSYAFRLSPFHIFLSLSFPVDFFCILLVLNRPPSLPGPDLTKSNVPDPSFLFRPFQQTLSHRFFSSSRNRLRHLLLLSVPSSDISWLIILLLFLSHYCSIVLDPRESLFAYPIFCLLFFASLHLSIFRFFLKKTNTPRPPPYLTIQASSSIPFSFSNHPCRKRTFFFSPRFSSFFFFLWCMTSLGWLLPDKLIVLSKYSTTTFIHSLLYQQEPPTCSLFLFSLGEWPMSP